MSTEYKNYTIWTIGNNTPFQFRGKYQKERENLDWLYFLKEDGFTFSFRKQNISAIQE